jgi:predicted nucleic acid-binding protein
MICDSSALLAAHVVGQRHQQACLNALNTAEHLVLSPLVLAELDQIVSTKVAPGIAARILRELAGGDYQVAPFEGPDFRSALDVMSQYDDLGLGLTDASLVVLAKRYKTNQILTLDERHFRAIRGFDGRHFQLLPLDLD